VDPVRIRVISCIRIRMRINLQITSQNVWNMSLFEHFFKVSSFYLETRILIDPHPHLSRIQVCMKVKGRIRIRIRIKMTSRIRIRIKVTRIRNTGFFEFDFAWIRINLAHPDPENNVIRQKC
jgi:hypothetical protein